MFENLLSWLLLPLGVVLGLNLARKRGLGESMHDGSHRPASVRAAGAEASSTDDSQTTTAPHRGADADPAVIELQMTLGSLFRKRGEVERAIHLHESVLARPALSAKDAANARQELAQDFLRAGLMDRAETLLNQLVASGEQLASALELLLDLYEQGRDWKQAIATARRLENVLGSSLAPRIGQYLCEVAETALHRGDLETARREAERALDTHRDCARASLLLGGLAEKREDWPAAIRAYQRVIEQDRRYLPEVLVPLKRCHEAAGNAAAYLQFLDDAVADHPDSIPVALAKVDQIRARGGNAQAYLASRLASKPDWRALLTWLEGEAGPDDPGAAQVREALKKRLDARPRYVCSSCGLTPTVLFWQCPSCKQWASIAPVTEGL